MRSIRRSTHTGEHVRNLGEDSCELATAQLTSDLEKLPGEATEETLLVV